MDRIEPIDTGFLKIKPSSCPECDGEVQSLGGRYVLCLSCDYENLDKIEPQQGGG